MGIKYSLFVFILVFTSLWTIPIFNNTVFQVVPFLLLSILFILGIFFRNSVKGNIHIPNEGKYLLIFVFFSLFSLSGIFILGPTHEKISEFLKTFCLLLVFTGFFLVFNNIKYKTIEKSYVKYFLYAMIILSFIGIIQFILFNFNRELIEIWPLYYKTNFTTSYSLSRANSLFKEPAWFGYYVVAAQVISTILYQYKKITKRKFLIFTAIYLFALISTLSLGAIAVFTLWIIYHKKLNIIFYFKIISILSIIFAIILIKIPELLLYFTNRIFRIITFQEGSFIHRFDSSLAAIKVFLLNPATGVGLGNYQIYAKDFVYLDKRLIGNQIIYSDNAYLGLLSEVGILGLLFFLIFIYFLLKKPNDLPKKDSLYFEIFKNLIVLNLIEMFLIGSFFLPRIWIEFTMLMYVKSQFRKEKNEQ